MSAFSRILYDEEMLIVYNDLLTHEDEQYMMIDRHLNPEGAKGKIRVLKNEDGSHRSIKIKLKPAQFVILNNGNIEG